MSVETKDGEIGARTELSEDESLQRFFQQLSDARKGLDGPGVPVELFTEEHLPDLFKISPKAFETLRAIAESSRLVDKERVEADRTLRELGLNPGTIDNGDRRFVLTAKAAGYGELAVKVLMHEALSRIEIGVKNIKDANKGVGFLGSDPDEILTKIAEDKNKLFK